MDTLILYLLGVIVCLLLSWYINREFITNVSLQDKLSLHSLLNEINYSFYSVRAFFRLLTLLLALLVLVFFMYSRDPEIKMAIGAYALIIVGAVSFQVGFKRMVELQLIRDIPTSRIRSVAVGIVELYGTVVPEQVLATPYSKSPCVFYRSRLDQYQGAGESEGWKTVSVKEHKISFGLKDETGLIAINPEGAELKVPEKNGGFLSQNGAPMRIDLSYTYKPGDKKYFEHFLSPGDRVYVLGTAAVTKKGEKQQIVIQKGTNNPTFIISDGSERDALHASKRGMILGFLSGITLFIAGCFLILRLSQLL